MFGITSQLTIYRLSNSPRPISSHLQFKVNLYKHLLPNTVYIPIPITLAQLGHVIHDNPFILLMLLKRLLPNIVMCNYVSLL